MSEKTEMQDIAIRILEAHDIEYIHLPNRMFGKYKTPLKLKTLPDLIFTYNNKFYMREFGIHGRHEDRKREQWERMQKWKRQADSNTDIAMIWSRAELEDDFRRIGLLV